MVVRLIYPARLTGVPSADYSFAIHKSYSVSEHPLSLETLAFEFLAKEQWFSRMVITEPGGTSYGKAILEIFALHQETAG